MDCVPITGCLEHKVKYREKQTGEEGNTIELFRVKETQGLFGVKETMERTEDARNETTSEGER